MSVEFLVVVHDVNLHIMHGVKFVHSCHVTGLIVFDVCSWRLDRLGKKIYGQICCFKQ